MRAAIIIRDLRDGSIEMTTEMEEVSSIEHRAPPTAASIHLVGAMALFNAGVMAQAGAIAVKEIEEGRDPLQAIKERYV